MLRFAVNGHAASFNGPTDTPLLWVLRDGLGLTGAKFGCGLGQCGACTVHLDGAAVRSCVLPVAAIAGKSVTTIEGLSSPAGQAVRQAWVNAQVPQCGYCQPGFVMAASAALAENPKASGQDLEAAVTNLCRCGTYARVRIALASARQAFAGSGV
jgi:isoquinoline 1-oxidoreductase alpha subunit